VRRLAAALAGLALIAPAGCAPYPIAPATAPTRVAPPPAAPAPAPAPVAPAPAPQRSPIPRPDVSVNDPCGAAPMQRLVGRPRTEAPVPLIPARQRVACTTCPITQDYDPERLNIFFDAQTGVIKEVRCG
jgi:hypothetical protein